MKMTGRPTEVIDGYVLVKTSPGCPEQYDVYDQTGAEVGYLRLRHGQFTVNQPSDGPIVYSAASRGDGWFEDDERDRHLRAAVKAIHNSVTGEPIACAWCDGTGVSGAREHPADSVVSS